MISDCGWKDGNGEYFTGIDRWDTLFPYPQTADLEKKNAERGNMYYNIEKMDGYFRIGSPENVFCYLIEGTDKAMLIDTGFGYGNLREAVRSVTDKPLVIINTHGHCDHVGGNGQFEESCFIHEQDLALCYEHSNREIRAGNVEQAKHSLNYETGEMFDALPEDFEMETYLNRSCGNLQTIKEGDLFELGKASMEILETPGHTRGGISVLYREKNLLFIGDAAGFFVWLFAKETTSRETYIHTLEKMYALQADGYIGAHNPEIMHKEDFQLYIRAASEADYEKGEPFESFFAQETKPKVCALDGMTLKDMFRPGFAAVVISAEK